MVFVNPYTNLLVQDESESDEASFEKGKKRVIKSSGSEFSDAPKSASNKAKKPKEALKSSGDEGVHAEEEEEFIISD